MMRRKEVGGVADEAAQGKNVRELKGGAFGASAPDDETRLERVESFPFR